MNPECTNGGVKLPFSVESEQQTDGAGDKLPSCDPGAAGCLHYGHELCLCKT